MKKKTRIAAVALALAVGTGTVALAAGNLVSISVFPGMNLAINGETFVPKDVNGKEVDVFSYNGTTYVPIRAISQAFGMDVSYDDATKTAMVDEPEKVTPPYNPTRMDYVLSVAPETVTNEDGTKEIVYYDVYHEFHWWLPEEQQDQSFTVKLVEGTLPDGIKLVGDHLEGQCLAAGVCDATFVVTPKNGDPVTRSLRFQFTEPDEFNVEPVVLTGVVGEPSQEWHINNFYGGLLYTGDDFDENNPEFSNGFLGSGDIGSQAGLDALAEYGLTLTVEERQEEDGYHWADNIISGVFTKGTDGWVKISIPAYAGVGTGNSEQPLNSAWWIVGEGTNYEEYSALYGNIDVYLNVVDFE